MQYFTGNTDERPSIEAMLFEKDTNRNAEIKLKDGKYSIKDVAKENRPWRDIFVGDNGMKFSTEIDMEKNDCFTANTQIKWKRFRLFVC